MMSKTVLLFSISIEMSDNDTKNTRKWRVAFLHFFFFLIAPYFFFFSSNPATLDCTIMFVKIMIAKIEEQSDILKEFSLEASVRCDPA